ncbi:PTS sugar transporter subunit IIC [Pediococcus acidilactici]|nr:PTS sugar transporter subunit IIC [Pediococcus acidilactici]UWF34297.1 PTS transporter subunit EIIC [Pediococcus acidilactici]
MKTNISNLFNRLDPFLNKLGQNNYLQTLSNAMVALMGPLFIGSMAILLNVFPIDSVQSFVKNINLSPILNVASTFTIGAMALYIVFLMAKTLVHTFMGNDDDGTMAGVIGLMCFFFVTPTGTLKNGSIYLTTTWTGAQGVFSAIIIGLFIGRIYVLFKQNSWTIKMPAGVPPMVSQVFESLIPAIVLGTFFIIVAWLFSLTSVGSMHQFIYQAIQTPLKHIGGSLGAMILVSILQQLLCFFGLHGTNILMPIIQPIWMSMDMENLTAFQHGQPLPNIIGLVFFYTVTFSASQIGLCILMNFSKSKRYRNLGRLTIIPSLFGVNEPTIFGLPIVMNFKLAIPHLFLNSLELIFSYFLIKVGIVSRFMGTQAVFGLPLGFHAAIQGSISIILLQLFLCLIVQPIAWYPFFKSLEKEDLKMQRVNNS